MWQTRRLTVAGDGFKFSVSPPDGWSVRTGNPPRFKYQAILMVWPRARGVAVPLVTVDAKIKTGKSMQDELSVILGNYTKKHKDASIGDLKITHSEYGVAGKTIGMTGKYHEYIVFLDPGKGFHYWIVARMMSMEKPAGESGIKAFQEIVESISYQGDIPLPVTSTVTGGSAK